MAYEYLYTKTVEEGATLELTLSADVVKFWRPYQGTWFEYRLIRRKNIHNAALGWESTFWEPCFEHSWEEAKPINSQIV